MIKVFTSLLVLSTPLAASKAASSSAPLPSSTGCRPACSQHCLSLSNKIIKWKILLLICVQISWSLFYMLNPCLFRSEFWIVEVLKIGPVAAQSSTVWGLASAESPEERVGRKFSWNFDQLSNLSSVLRENLHHPPLHLEMRVKFNLTLEKGVLPDHCEQQGHHCPRVQESHLNRRRVPLLLQGTWEDEKVKIESQIKTKEPVLMQRKGLWGTGTRKRSICSIGLSVRTTKGPVAPCSCSCCCCCWTLCLLRPFARSLLGRLRDKSVRAALDNTCSSLKSRRR